MRGRGGSAIRELATEFTSLDERIVNADPRRLETGERAAGGVNDKARRWAPGLASPLAAVYAPAKIRTANVADGRKAAYAVDHDVNAVTSRSR